MFRRFPIRVKLGAALALPLAALVVVATLEVFQTRQDAHDVREQTALATAVTGPNGLISDLQNERNFGGIWLIDQQDLLRLPVQDYKAAKAATDESLADFRATVEGESGHVQATYGPALRVLDGLPEVRAKVDGFQGERNLQNEPAATDVFNAYSRTISALFDANTQLALVIDDPTLRRGAEMTDIASRQTDIIADLVRRLLISVVSEDSRLGDPEEIAPASALFGEVKANEALVRSLGAGVYRPLAEKLQRESDALGFTPFAQETLDTGAAVNIPALLETVSAEDDESWYGFRSSLETVIEERADELNAAATARQRWFLGLAAIAVLAAGVVTWLVSRSITRPLRSLTRQAKTMADARLPDAVLDILETPLGEDVTMPHVPPVEVTTRDEVADVADALNTVQDSALDLAVEQAVLRRNIADSFVNLGRRNQNLLGRQLDFITELEAHETDPDTLANLFRLDHLATRMRRNAESLLVLAGIEPPRKWAAPVRLTDVIRAALGEVEDYQRVTVRAVEPATILGSVAADLAHLLAELIENALIFSPPDQTVEIRGRGRTDGYTLAIIDSGLGMAPDDVERANRRLAGAESFTIAPSKYLGHYVAGNLAARHNIAVQLDNSPGNGITATINLPPTLLTTDTPDTTIDVTPRSTLPAAPAGTVAIAPPAPGVLPARQLEPGSTRGGNGDRGLPHRPAPEPAPATGPESTSPARTSGGLVKRSPSRGPSAPAPGAPNMPSAELLDSLRGYATDLQSQIGTPLAPTAGQVPQPPPAPPVIRPPATGPLPPPAPPGDSPWAGLNLPTAHSAEPLRPPPRVPPTGPDTDPGLTAGGLTRRVRGAQLPATNPLALRRTGENRPAYDVGGPAGEGNGTRDATGGPNGDRDSLAGTSAKDVYSFLTSFTAGVQRGLDEARGNPTTPEEE